MVICTTTKKVRPTTMAKEKNEQREIIFGNDALPTLGGRGKNDEKHTSKHKLMEKRNKTAHE